jgi:hypothetical protein
MPALERAPATIRSHNNRKKGLLNENKSHRIRAKRLIWGEMVNGEELQVQYVRDKAEEENVHGRPGPGATTKQSETCK